MGNPSVFQFSDSKDLCDPTHDRFVQRDTTKFLQVSTTINNAIIRQKINKKNKTTILAQFTLKDTTEKQRLYNGDVKRTYILKIKKINKGTANLPLLVQALPEKIEWPQYKYYKVAGHYLNHPKDWLLPVEPPAEAVRHDDYPD